MLFDDSYNTIQSPAEGVFKDRGSKFLGLAFQIANEQEVKKYLQEVKKEHYQCNHHCYAFRLTPDTTIFRFSDDREPAGTAGKPILGQIQSKELTDVLVIVARYYGGTLLGVPGLIAAYKAAAADALNNSTIITKTINDAFEITFPYEQTNDVLQWLRSEPATLKEQDYNEPCKIVFEIRRGRTNDLMQKLKNNYVLESKIDISAL